MEQASEHLKTEQRTSSRWWNKNITNTRKMSDSRVSTETWDRLKWWAWWSFNWMGHININTELIIKIDLHRYVSSPDSVHSLWLALAGSPYPTAEVIIIDNDDDYSSIKVSVLSSGGLGCASVNRGSQRKEDHEAFLNHQKTTCEHVRWALSHQHIWQVRWWLTVCSVS